MTETTYKDYIPANARVIIDYRKDDKVRFSYPIEYTYEQAVNKFVYDGILNWWLSVNFLLLSYTTISLVFIWCALLILLQLKDPYLFTTFLSMYTNMESFNTSYFFIPWLIYLFFIPYVIKKYLMMDKERLSRFFPLFGYHVAKLFKGTKEMIFYAYDVADNKVVIPVFHNVFLEYNALDDFGRYLDRIEILEIPYFYKKYIGFWPWSKKVKKLKNEYRFRAVFFFSNTPLIGRLECEFV